MYYLFVYEAFVGRFFVGLMVDDGIAENIIGYMIKYF